MGTHPAQSLSRGEISIKPQTGEAGGKASEATAMDSILRFGKKADDAKKKPPSHSQHGNASKLPRAVEDTLAKVRHTHASLVHV